MKHLTLIALLLLAGCHSAPVSQTASVNPQAADKSRTSSVTVVGIPADNEITKAHAVPQHPQKRRPGVGRTPPSDNSEAAKQARTFLSMSSQERLEWTDQLLKGSHIDVRDPE